MNKFSRAAISLAAVMAISACREAQMPLPAAPAVVPQADAGPPPPKDISVDVGGICNIEAIGELTGPALDQPVAISGTTTVSGWRAQPAEDGSEAPAWLRVVGANGEVAKQVFLPATEDRPDVAEAAKREGALRSGFRRVEIAGLSPGSYSLDIVLNVGPNWVRCAHARKIDVK